MTDFSTPRRMSVGAFMIMFLDYFRKFAGTAIIVIVPLLFNSDEHKPVKAFIALGVLVAVALFAAFMAYYFRKFHVEGDMLIFTHGFAAKQTTSIPLQRIHILRTKKGLFYRLFNMRGIGFDTLANDGEEVELILSERDWRELLSRVNVGENFDRTLNAVLPPPLPAEQHSLRLKNTNIIKGALCQNHLKGFAVLASIAFAVFDKINQLDDDASSRIIDFIDANGGNALPTGLWQTLCFFVTIYLIVMMLWLCKVALRYGNMAIEISGEKMTVTSGLFSHFTSRLSRDKITVLTVKQNPLEKMADCQTVTLHQANNASKDGGIRIYGSMLGGELLAWWSGRRDAGIDAPFLSAESGKGLVVRKFVPHVMIASLAAFCLVFYAHIVWSAILAGSVYVAIAFLRAVLAWKHSKIELTDTCIKIYCGNIARIHEYVKYHDIESVCVRSTPLTSCTRRVSLRISTNAKEVRVPSIEIGNALAIQNAILNKAESSHDEKLG